MLGGAQNQSGSKPNLAGVGIPEGRGSLGTGGWPGACYCVHPFPSSLCSALPETSSGPSLCPVTAPKCLCSSTCAQVGQGSVPSAGTCTWGPSSVPSRMGDALLELTLLGMRDGTSRSAFLVTQGAAEHLQWRVQPLLYQLKSFQTPLAPVPNPTVLTDPKTLLPHPRCVHNSGGQKDRVQAEGSLLDDPLSLSVPGCIFLQTALGASPELNTAWGWNSPSSKRCWAIACPALAALRSWGMSDPSRASSTQLTLCEHHEIPWDRSRVPTSKQRAREPGFCAARIVGCELETLDSVI